MAGGNHLLVDYRADVKTLRHAYIINVFYFCHCFIHTHTFGGKAGEDVRFGVSGQCHKSFCVFETFFDEQVHIAAVSVDNHGTIVQ